MTLYELKQLRAECLEYIKYQKECIKRMQKKIKQINQEIKEKKEQENE